jgi:hypothetical protein
MRALHMRPEMTAVFEALLADLTNQRYASVILQRAPRLVLLAAGRTGVCASLVNGVDMVLQVVPEAKARAALFAHVPPAAWRPILGGLLSVQPVSSIRRHFFSNTPLHRTNYTITATLLRTNMM